MGENIDLGGYQIWLPDIEGATSWRTGQSAAGTDTDHWVASVGIPITDVTSEPLMVVRIRIDRVPDVAANHVGRLMGAPGVPPRARGLPRDIFVYRGTLGLSVGVPLAVADGCAGSLAVSILSDHVGAATIRALAAVIFRSLNTDRSPLVECEDIESIVDAIAGVDSVDDHELSWAPVPEGSVYAALSAMQMPASQSALTLSELEQRAALVLIDVLIAEEDIEEGAIPADFPGLEIENWRAVVELDSGQIQDWPTGVVFELWLKVTDGGTYTLLDRNRQPLARLEGYVPHGVVPGETGDYLELKIDGSGQITNWPVPVDLEEFDHDASADDQ